MASVSGLAAEVTKMANQVQASGKQLSDAASGANWSGKAADQFRESADARARDFKNCVSLLDEAASALKALAAKVG
ncbi:MAG: WXG100 family type VII secretion target [Nocardiopsaceae bacterium]|nr:WXG100 family type VII secretion target [Nocardiopsaceae bacterium]